MTKFSRRDLAAFGVSMIAAGLMGDRASAAQPDAMRDPDFLRYVDPELRSAALQTARMEASTPPLSDEALASARKGMAYPPAPLADVPHRQLAIAGPKGAPPVRIHVINERAGEAQPAILHTHGGGFVLGTAAQSVRGLQQIAKTLDCIIVTVDYRLAPETGYAGSIEDNYSGLRWLHDNAEQVGADPKRIAVMGESAGGGHAALLAITARDRGEVPLVYQCLTYPMLDDRTGSSRPVPPMIGRVGWSAANNRYGWHSFLGETPGTARVPARAVPARVSSVAGLPPTFIGVGALDLFVGEDMDYASRLIAAGVATELVVVPGAYHGFDGYTSKSIAQRFNSAKMNALRRALSATM